MAATSDSPRTSRLPLPASPRVSRIPQPTTSTSSPSPLILKLSSIPRGPVNGERRVVNTVPLSPALISRPLLPSGTANPTPTASIPRLSSKSSSTSLTTPRKPGRTASRITPSIAPPTPSRLRTAASSYELRGTSERKPPTIRSKASVDTLRRSELPFDNIAPPKSPSRVSIREQIAAKRKALLEASGVSGRSGKDSGVIRRRPSNNDLNQALSGLAIGRQSPPEPSGDIFGRTIPTLIRKAMTTGRLDVANMSLERLPMELWTKILKLSGDDLPQYEEAVKAVSIVQPWDDNELAAGGNDLELPPHELERRKRLADDEIMNVPFYEVEDLAVIKASGNALTFVEDHIGLVGALKSLDLHSNQLRSLPDSLINLRELTTLDISDNMLTAVPASVILSPSLAILNMSKNNVTSISWEDPVRPNPDVLQSRKDSSFFDSFPSTPTKSTFRDDDIDEILPSIRSLSLAGNGITNLGLPSKWPRNIESIDLSDNMLQGILDVTALSLLPRLNHLYLRGNGIIGMLIRAEDGADLWPSLVCIDLEKNEIRNEAALVETMKLWRPHTTGGSAKGVVQLKLAENPIIQAAVRKGHPATIAHRVLKPIRGDIDVDEPAIQRVESTPGSPGHDTQVTGPLVGCWDGQRQSVVVTRNIPVDFLVDGILDLQQVIDAVPATDQLRSVEISGILKLQGLMLPPDCSRLGSIITFSITDSALSIDEEILGRLSEVMPKLETLNLSGSRIEHLHGIEHLCANGLKRLLVKGCRIRDITSLNAIAAGLHAGTWTGLLQLDEVDIRDNAVEKLDPVSGCLPLRHFLVENNAFRVPQRRIWERDGTAGLLRWLRDAL